jgi:predicted dehydrogenase
MKKYNVGIIGYGGFGQFLRYWWTRLPNITVVAIADPRPVENPDCKIYHDWKELVNDPGIDIVSIVTPPFLHTEMACAAMRANKHVLLEKPLATTVQGALQIMATQNETGMVLTVDHMIRYNPIIQSLMALGHSGTFGKLRHAVVNNYAQDAGLPPDHWFWKNEISGGILIEHGVHFFDIVNGLSGQHYQQVFGCSHDRNASQRDQVAAMVLYDDGLIGSYYHSFSGPGFFEETTIQLAYDLARVEIKGWMPMKGTVKAMVNNQSKESLGNIPGWTVSRADTISDLRDVSRPEGWGNGPDTAMETGDNMVHSGGIGYDVDEMVTGTFEINETKGQVYGQCVQSILMDMIKKIENKDHKLKISAEDAYEALKIALIASNKV